MSAAGRPISSSPFGGHSPNVPCLSLRREQASAALGISEESFDRYVRPYLAVVRLGTLRLYAVAELERFLAEHGSVLADELERAA